MIYLGNDIDILKDGEIIAKVGFSDEAEHNQELMKENYILLPFNLDCHYSFDRGHTITYKGEEYMIREETPPEEINVQEYHFKPKFEGLEMQFHDIIMFYPLAGSMEVEWMMTAPPKYFLDIAIILIRDYFKDDTWEIGIIEYDQPLDMSFDGTSIFDTLTEMADKAECEWYVKNKKLHFVKKYVHGDLVELEREVNLEDMQRTNENDEEYCTRLYAFGSTRNIPKDYRKPAEGEIIDVVAPKRLRLPEWTGGYIDAWPNMKPYEIVPKVVKFEEEFPQRVGTITSIRTERKPNEDGDFFTIYYFKDTGIILEKEDMLLPGLPLMMRFTSGKLAGRDFELDYKEERDENEKVTGGEYEIINDQSNPDIIIPNDLLMPEVGNEYVLYNFNIDIVGKHYVPEAEEKLLKTAEEYLRKVVEDNATYTCPTAAAVCYEEDINLDVGQRVRLISPMFKKGYKDSRVFGFRKKLIDEYECTYLIGDVSEYSKTGIMGGQITVNKKESDEKHTENKKGINVVKRNMKSFDYIKKALEMNTSVEGALILSAILMLGVEKNGEFKAMAGLNGLLDSPESVAFWIGGDLEDAIAKKTALGFSADGSGWFANNTISWNDLGLLVTGKYQTAKKGERIEIDPSTRSIKMIDNNEKTIVNISFNNSNERHTALMRINNYVNGGEAGSAVIEGDKISLLNQTGDEYFSVALNNNKLNVKLDGIPESRDETEVKMLYVDEDETLKLRKD